MSDHDSREVREAREAEQGYRESSLREVRLREWFSGRDDPRKDVEFKKLSRRLYIRKWLRSVRSERGERWERVKAQNRAYARRQASARTARLWERVVADAVVVTCICGATFCNVPAAGPDRRWCSLSCRRRVYKRNRSARAHARRRG